MSQGDKESQTGTDTEVVTPSLSCPPQLSDFWFSHPSSLFHYKRNPRDTPAGKPIYTEYCGVTAHTYENKSVDLITRSRRHRKPVVGRNGLWCYRNLIKK